MKKKINEIQKLSKEDRQWVQEALRYYSPKDIVKEFKTKAERKAIAAVFEWLNLNGVCGWTLKDRGRHISTTAYSRRIHRELNSSDVVVIDRERLEEAEKLFGIK